jgi:hypothetical protein
LIGQIDPIWPEALSERSQRDAWRINAVIGPARHFDASYQLGFGRPGPYFSASALLRKRIVVCVSTLLRTATNRQQQRSAARKRTVKKSYSPGVECGESGGSLLMRHFVSRIRSNCLSEEQCQAPIELRP